MLVFWIYASILTKKIYIQRIPTGSLELYFNLEAWNINMYLQLWWRHSLVFRRVPLPRHLSPAFDFIFGFCKLSFEKMMKCCLNYPHTQRYIEVESLRTRPRSKVYWIAEPIYLQSSRIFCIPQLPRSASPFPPGRSRSTITFVGLTQFSTEIKAYLVGNVRTHKNRAIYAKLFSYKAGYHARLLLFKLSAPMTSNYQNIHLGE